MQPLTAVIQLQSEFEALRGAHAMECDLDLVGRLATRKRILDLIDRRRQSECDTGVGWAIEQKILSEELASVGEPVLEDVTSPIPCRVLDLTSSQS